MPKTKNQHIFTRTSDGLFTKNDPPNENIEENVKIIELDETENLLEHGGKGRVIEEDYLNSESDWSTDSERGEGQTCPQPVETRIEYCMKREAAQKEQIRWITSKDLSDAKGAKKVHDAKFSKKGKTLAT